MGKCVSIPNKSIKHDSALPRRSFIFAASTTTVASILAPSRFTTANEQTGELKLATFRFEVTPPLGHSLCGGWIKPAEAVDDSLEAIGFVLLGAGEPIVICAVDWTGLLNSANLKWRQALADAAGTTPDRVAVHCVHQHNAPFACLEAEEIVQAQGDLPHIVEPDFFQRCLDAGRKAVEASLESAIPVTHVATGEALVEKVASNRRIIGLDGKHISQRGSSSTKPEHHRFPEGLIDPALKTVALYHNEKKLVAMHYYACHPMSYYGDGRVSADFCGLARKARQEMDPDCVHIYFNGCGGNIGAGKYNDRSVEKRPLLSRRVLDGIVASEEALVPQPIQTIRWQTHDILPPIDSRFEEEALMELISRKDQRIVTRNRSAYTVSFIRRIKAGIPITLSALHVNDASLLHLPAESFVEYQLRAQAAAPDRFVACAAYGDGGPWYIPTKEAYPQGGYAVSVAWCDPAIDGILCGGIQNLLA